MEKAERSRWLVGESAAARQILTISSGSVVFLRRERAARDFCLLVSGVDGSEGLRIAEGEVEVEVERWRGRRRWRRMREVIAICSLV